MRLSLQTVLATFLFLLSGSTSLPALDEKKDDSSNQGPPELRGAKVYHLPDETKSESLLEDLLIYRSLSYQSVDFERLTLNLSLSVKPVDRAATIRRVYFQDIRINAIPVHIETFEQEFKLSKKEAVNLPAPLQCSLVFSDLESLKPVQEIVEKDKIRITGRSFIEVKLNPLEKLALRSKRLVLQVSLDEEVPLQMFSQNPFAQTVLSKMLGTLSDSSSTVALALAKEHSAKLAASRTLEPLGRASLYLLYCEYTLRHPKTQVAEKFSQYGTGFVVSTDGKLLTAKRVVEPWKFDSEIAFLLSRDHLEFDPKSYKLWAWPASARVLSPDGQLNSETASSTEKQTLKILRTAPDRMEQREYQDRNSGTRSTPSLHASRENDAALLQLVGAHFHALAFADPAAQLSQDVPIALLGFPFGLSQAEANPQLVFVKATRKESRIDLDHQLDPGESGSPLLTPDGKVLALAGGSNECVSIEAFRSWIP